MEGRETTEARAPVVITHAVGGQEMRTPIVRSSESLHTRLAAVGRASADVPDGSVGRMIAAAALGEPYRSRLEEVEQRALVEGADAAGGFLVPEILSARFLDRVRARTQVLNAGAVTVPMGSDTMHLARLEQPGLTPAPAWKVELDPIAASNLVFGRVTLRAHTLPALVELSVELSEDAPNIDQVLETELSAALALELDRAALHGSGVDPEPRGVKHWPGVTVGTLAAPSNYDGLIDLMAPVWLANHTVTGAIYPATLAVTLAKLKNSNGDPLQAPESWTSVPRYPTTQAGEDVFVGDWSQLLIGMRTAFKLEVSRQASEMWKRLGVSVRAYLRADVALAHAEAFSVGTPTAP